MVNAGDVSSGEHSTDWFEVTAAVLLGLSAVLIAWAAYQAQLWGGVQDTKNTESVLVVVDAADEFGRADAERSLDQLLFVDLIGETDQSVIDILLGQMSPAGVTAVDQWYGNNELSPFDDEAYRDSVYGQGFELYENSSVLFEEAGDANRNGDDYTLAATVLVVVLFLVGVSLVLRIPRVRMALLAGSAVLLAGIGIFLVTLPVTS
jgi:hypothetical protein